MRFIHTSDLHLGKRVNEFSMTEDQRHILLRIIDAADEMKPDAVLIAGDVYDKASPPAEAVALFDDFLTRLSERGIPVFVISGNHDSAERIAFGSRIMRTGGIYFSPVYDADVRPVTLEDEFGSVDIWMLPFVKPANVRRFFPELPADTYTQALACAVSGMAVDRSRRNVLVTHQFVTGGSRSESEEISAGGTDNVDGWVFEPFDYVALGHLHGPQYAGSPNMRYCGSPLKYSFSEKDQQKSITVVDMGSKGEVNISVVPLAPRFDMREIRGSYEELMLRSSYEGTNTSDYLRVVLTDEEDVFDAMARLRSVYPNIMKLEYARLRREPSAYPEEESAPEGRTEAEFLADFYERQNGRPMRAEQAEYAASAFAELKKAGGEVGA